MKKKIDLNQTPLWSSWPQRLLSATTAIKRNAAKIKQEYNEDKYGACLDAFLKSGGKMSAAKLKSFEDGDEKRWCVSEGNDLFVASLGEIKRRYYEILISEIFSVAKKDDIIVELGCGYGANLAMLDECRKGENRFIGGEYSANAVRLSHLLYKNKPNISVSKFDFYEPECKFMEKLEKPAIFFTAHAIEQLPSATPFFDLMEKYKNKVKMVINFEVGYETQDESLLGLMRKKYIDICDYNRDLISQLKKRSDTIKVIKRKDNVIGINFLNPTTIVQWKFKK